MSRIVENKARVANFTSSKVYNLIKKGSREMTAEELEKHKKANPGSRKKNIDAGFAAGGLTYIKQRFQEAKRKRSVNTDAYSKAIAWGDIMEMYVYERKLDLSYEITSTETASHPKIKRWKGSTDLLVPRVKIGEIKCYQPEKWCKYADCLLARDLKAFREDFPEEYWQIVSNAEIHQVKRGEAITYLPYDSEAGDIADFVHLYDGEDVWRYEYIFNSIMRQDHTRQLPFQPDDSGYPDLVSWEFEIPREDAKYLTERVEEAIVEVQALEKADQKIIIVGQNNDPWRV